MPPPMAATRALGKNKLGLMLAATPRTAAASPMGAAICQGNEFIRLKALCTCDDDTHRMSTRAERSLTLATPASSNASRAIAQKSLGAILLDRIDSAAEGVRITENILPERSDWIICFSTSSR